MKVYSGRIETWPPGTYVSMPHKSFTGRTFLIYVTETNGERQVRGYAMPGFKNMDIHPNSRCDCKYVRQEDEVDDDRTGTRL